MEDQMKGQVCDEKMCGMNGCGFGRHNGWYHLIRWILGVAIILIVFCFGMMIGQLRGELGMSFGYRMTRVQSYGRMYPMMQGQNGYYGGAPVAQPQTAPATGAAPSANQ